MGTNFFFLIEDGATKTPIGDPIPPIPDSDEFYILTHIGRRSAAGPFCWDCNATLKIGGIARLHYDHGFYDDCPECGKPFERESLTEGASGVELGFAQPRQQRPTGVGTCSSFSWAIDPIRVIPFLVNHWDAVLIEDEYGTRYTGGEFVTMLQANCPIQFTHSIGVWFS